MGRKCKSALDTSQRLLHETIPFLVSRASEVRQKTGFSTPGSLDELDSTLVLLKSATTWLALYDDSVVAADLPELISRLGKAKDGGLRALWLSWTDASVKAAKKRIIELRRGNSVALSQTWKELSDIQLLRQDWEKLSGELPFPSATPI